MIRRKKSSSRNEYKASFLFDFNETSFRKAEMTMTSWFSSIRDRVKTFLSRAVNIFITPYAHRTPLGQVLLKEKIITKSQLNEALEIQKNKLKHLGQIIVDNGYATEIEVLQAIANHYRISATTLSEDLEDLIRKRPLTLKDKLSYLRIPIRVKLSIAITFMIWVTILILSFVILARQRDSLYEQTVKTGKISLNYFRNNARIPLLKDNILNLNTLIKEAASVEGLLYATIVDRGELIRAHTDPALIGTMLEISDTAKISRDGDISYFNFTLPDGPHVLNLFAPVTFKDVALGEVHVGISLDFIKKQIYKESVFIIILSLFIVLLGIAISILIGIGFSRPISRLVLATQEIGKGNFHYKIEMIRKDEFGDLATAFNYMTQELWKKLCLQQSFGRYISPEVLEMIMAHPEDSWLKGSRSEASILFADVRGFTAYAENRQPEEMVEALNEYFGIATQCILEYGGYIDKFIGDAVLGVFGVPVHQADHAERAVRAAVALQQQLKTAGQNGNVLLSKIGIGINAGVVVSGNLGSQVKMEYTVIGDSVNIAARINSLAGPGEIIVSKEIYDSVKQTFSMKQLPPKKIKGKSAFIEVYEVLGEKK
jgi:adenylate cyclase